MSGPQTFLIPAVPTLLTLSGGNVRLGQSYNKDCRQLLAKLSFSTNA